MTIPPSLAYFLNIDRTGDYDSQSGNYRSSRLDLDERLAALEKEIRAAKSEAPLHLVLFAHGGLNTERIGAETNLGVQQKIVGKLGSSAHLFALLWENGLCETLQHVAGQTALTELVEQAKRSYNAPPKVIFENLSSLKRLDPPGLKPQGYELYASSSRRQLVRLMRSSGQSDTLETLPVFRSLTARSDTPYQTVARSLMEQATSDEVARRIVRRFEADVASARFAPQRQLNTFSFLNSGGSFDGHAPDEAAFARWLKGLVARVVSSARHVVGAVNGWSLEVRRYVMEELARALGLVDIARSGWQAMKDMAKWTFGDGVSKDVAQGREMPGRLLVQRLMDWRQAYPEQFQMSLIGHSAGTILHSRLLEAANVVWQDKPSGPPLFKNLVFLAAAISYADFENRVLAHQHLFERFLALGLKDGHEQDSGDALNGLYPASLLYIVSDVLEAVPGEQLVGMQKFLNAPGYSRAKAFLKSSDRILWTPKNGVSEQRSHSGFATESVTAAYLAQWL